MVLQVSDAEKYAAKDSERKAAIEAKNEADSLIYSGGFVERVLIC